MPPEQSPAPASLRIAVPHESTHPNFLRLGHYYIHRKVCAQHSIPMLREPHNLAKPAASTGHQSAALLPPSTRRLPDLPIYPHTDEPLPVRGCPAVLPASSRSQRIIYTSFSSPSPPPPLPRYRRSPHVFVRLLNSVDNPLQRLAHHRSDGPQRVISWHKVLEAGIKITQAAGGLVLS